MKNMALKNYWKKKITKWRRCSCNVKLNEGAVYYEIIIGIESSCDETSVAVLENDNNLLSNIVSSQVQIHQKYGVLCQSSFRIHVRQITMVLEELK